MMTEHLLMMQDPNETCNWDKETAGHCGNSIRPADTCAGLTDSRKEHKEEMRNLHNMLMNSVSVLLYGETLVS